MALSLKLYQKRAVASLAKFLEAARLDGPAAAFKQSVDMGLVDAYKPLPGLPEVPYACLRIPTGGGKTILGAHIIKAAADAYLERQFPLVLWMVPTTAIKSQTLDAFRDARHPYRQELDKAFGGHVEVFDIEEFTRVRPADLGTRMCLVVATASALRVEETEIRKVYQHNEDLEPHFAGSVSELDYLEQGEGGKAKASFANLLKLHGPLVVMDEAHNFITELSYRVYERLGVRCVVELTATPDLASSNVLVSVSAFELKAEHMIKFPVVLSEYQDDWQQALNEAVARQRSLRAVAQGEDEYIRPILLVKAENARGVATVEEVYKHLTEVIGLDAKSIAIATGAQRGLEDVDLFAKDCDIEVIITIQALKEGWDCSFAYVFCSVAEVRSDKDIQQLLGRVLRMPYATPRKQEQMNRAYAHVVAQTFSKAAGEFTRALVDIGFNPLEAQAALRRRRLETETKKLPLAGGGMHDVALPTTRLTLKEKPDLTSAPERDHRRVVLAEGEGGSGVVVEITDHLDEATVEALVLAAPRNERDAARTAIEQHMLATLAAKAPSERGAEFSVPRLVKVGKQGELTLVQHRTVAPGFEWDLLSMPADLSGFRIDTTTNAYVIELANSKSLTYRPTKDDVATYLPGFAQDRSVTDLIGWLAQEIDDRSIRAPVKYEWIRRAVDYLLETRGFSLAQLLRGQFILRRALEAQLEERRTRAYEAGFQQALFEGGLEVVTSDDEAYRFTYEPDMTAYPAHTYYDGPATFSKHFYPKPGHLPWRTERGQDTEEFICAKAIDGLEEVEFWVRNLEKPEQFWLPTSKQRHYPDFVAKLKDGRLFVVEYKGEHLYSNDDSKEKRLVGELWAKASGGRCIYRMVRVRDEKGRDMREQMINAIHE